MQERSGTGGTDGQSELRKDKGSRCLEERSETPEKMDEKRETKHWKCDEETWRVWWFAFCRYIQRTVPIFCTQKCHSFDFLFGSYQLPSYQKPVERSGLVGAWVHMQELVGTLPAGSTTAGHSEIP